ncbi:MAG TPA: PEP-CTERM sorting domain-containing protein [Chthoniobacteraceae bacterium]|nr:PEP-CTERM sorting domain-containing protein [Chthoniobacteraceae bacterium]
MILPNIRTTLALTLLWMMTSFALRPLNAGILVHTVPDSEFVAPANVVLFNPLPANSDHHRNLSIRWQNTTLTDRRDVGQRFELSEQISLGEIIIYVPTASNKDDADPDRPFSLIIEHFVDGTLSGQREMISLQGNLPKIPEKSYVVFKLSEAVTIQANQLYGFRFSFDSALDLAETKNLVAWGGVQQGYSAPGLKAAYYVDYSNNENLRPLSNPEVMVFYLAPQTIPEPGTGALLFIGMIGVAGLFRKWRSWK